jgi:hypothetical protein
MDVNTLFIILEPNKKAGGMGPPAYHRRMEMHQHLIFLPIMLVIVTIKVKIIIKKR